MPKVLKRLLTKWTVEIDVDSTRQWYASSAGWACDCAHCHNFLTIAHERKLPIQLLEVLDDLNISPEKSTYVCETYPDGDGYCYQVNFRVAGKILHGDESSLDSYDWGAVRCCHDPYPHGAPGFPEPHFDLQFWVTLPWVLPFAKNWRDVLRPKGQ